MHKLISIIFFCVCAGADGLFLVNFDPHHKIDNAQFYLAIRSLRSFASKKMVVLEKFDFSFYYDDYDDYYEIRLCWVIWLDGNLEWWW